MSGLPKIFFQIFSPNIKNGQRDKAVILSHICWGPGAPPSGWPPFPPPLRQPPPQPPAVTIRDPQGYMPWVYTLAAAYLVRGLASWHVCSAGQLHFSLPVEPHWHPGPPIRLIVSPPETLYWAIALLAESDGQPPGAGVALLTAVPPGD